MRVTSQKVSAGSLSCNKSKKIFKKSKTISYKPISKPIDVSTSPCVYDILSECSDIHKILLKSQQILNDFRREIEDMNTQLDYAQNNQIVDSLTVDLDNELYGTVNHKFMFNELSEEYTTKLSGIEKLKSGDCQYGSLYDRIEHSFDGGHFKTHNKNARS